MDHTFDVVVAGCGVAGLSAAVTAAEPEWQAMNS
jgi:succinate dehydrogenase/fumarate reductase flavoprotein subunit